MNEKSFHPLAAPRANGRREERQRISEDEAISLRETIFLFIIEVNFVTFVIKSILAQ